MTTKGFDVAVVGATGAVGGTLISILAERNFPVQKLYPLASERSVEKTVLFNGKNLPVKELSTFDFSKVQIAFFSAGSSVSQEYVKKAAQAGAWVIDNTSCFRYDNEIPLVVSEVNPDDFTLSNITYRTKTGEEQFLSFENLETRKLASFTRLRLPDNLGEDAVLPVLRGAALIRELHTYGRHTKVGGDGSQSQHVGFGRRLLAEADRIARERGYKKMAIISGIGVREYYQKLGYHLEETYMVKNL